MNKNRVGIVRAEEVTPGIYRVSHLNLSPPITRLGGQVSKKVSHKSCMVSRGNQNGVPFNFWF